MRKKKDLVEVYRCSRLAWTIAEGQGPPNTNISGCWVSLRKPNLRYIYFPNTKGYNLFAVQAGEKRIVFYSS